MAHRPETSSNVMNKKEAEEAADRFDYIRFTVTDTNGLARCKSVAKRNFEQFFANGVEIFSGYLMFGPRGEIEYLPTEVIDMNLGNAYSKPMAGTLHAVPWAADGKHRVGEVFCESFWIPPYREGAQQDACPRYVARKQLQKLAQLGYRLYSGFEAEFIVVDSEKRPLFFGCELLNGQLLSEYEAYIYSMDEKMAAAGIDVSTLHTEYGNGQFEFATNPKYGIETADQLFLLKLAVKEMTRQHRSEGGWQATFMSKPFLDTSGNGLHYSHSLWSCDETSDISPGRNVFYDATAEHGLSLIGRRWLAGLLRHGPALVALLAPTVNCYRRYGTPFSPTYIDWGTNYRSAAIRAKTGHPTSTYFENRLACGAANPYLVMAATIAAGIDGIVSELELPAPVTMEQRKKVIAEGGTEQWQPLPSSLAESLNALENDAVMCDSLGSEFIRWFVGLKRSVDIAKVAKARESNKTELEVEHELYFKYI